MTFLFLLLVEVMAAWAYVLVVASCAVVVACGMVVYCCWLFVIAAAAVAAVAAAGCFNSSNYDRLLQSSQSLLMVPANLHNRTNENS